MILEHKLATSLSRIVSVLVLIQQASAFHLSFGNRLLRSVQNPQLNPASTLIRPIECRNANNQSEVGICMFSIDCMQNKGVPLSVCKHNYFVGTCCRLPDYNNFVGIVYDLRDTETNQVLEARRVATTSVAPTTIGHETSTSSTSPTSLEVTSLLVPGLSPTSSSKEEQKLDSKYMISATSLFPPTPYPSSASTAANSESARNADGPHHTGQSEANNRNHQQLVVASELDSFHIQTALVGAPPEVALKVNPPTKLDQQQQYELIRDESSAGELPSTVSSAHSRAPSLQPVASHPATLQPETLGSVEVIQKSPTIETSSSHRPTQVLVMSNNHQQHANSAARHTTPESVHSSSSSEINQQPKVSSAEQEFAFSTEPTKVSSVTPPTLVDLVSGGQTSTPFTTSLSTALLPNISSHPYSPTTSPPSTSRATGASLSTLTSSVGSSYGNSSSPDSVGTTSSSQMTTSTAGPPNELVSNQTSPSAHHEAIPIQFGHVSQLYTQPPGEGERPASGVPGRPTQALNSMAPKIVGSTGPGSAVNQLMPGALGGFQSAILSHIPFKIASGLSSGLTSYLQAAMKPSGNRPVISSNTAPSGPYQAANRLAAQQAANQTASSAAGIRFPEPSSTTSPVASSSSSPSSSADLARYAQQVCGRPQVSHLSGQGESKRRVARIVGGNQSLFGQWPWMVSLRQWRKGAFLHKCGAALLNENWAITAAHCVENVKPADLLLRLGEFDVSNQDEPFPYTERRVKTVVSHPNFDPKTFEYDLALLRFAEPIKYERNILPVCVPSGNDTYVDRMATVIGWGRLYEDGPLPDVIQHVDVPIITNNECEKMYKNAGYIEEIPNMFICAGISKGGRDSCEGDSGGPLTMVDHDGRSYLVGIISWGIGCALPSQPGVYTRITAFSGWINQITAF